MNFEYEILKEFKDNIRKEFSRPIDELVASNKEVIKTVHELVLTIKDTQKAQEFLASRQESYENANREHQKLTDARLGAIEKSKYITWGNLAKTGFAFISLGSLLIAYLALEVDRKAHELELMKHESLEREKFALSIPSPEQQREIENLKKQIKESDK